MVFILLGMVIAFWLHKDKIFQKYMLRHTLQKKKEMMSLSILTKKENYSKILMIVMLRYWVMPAYGIVTHFKFA